MGGGISSRGGKVIVDEQCHVLDEGIKQNKKLEKKITFERY